MNNRLEAALLKDAEIAAAERQIAAREALNNRLEAALLKEEGALEIRRRAAAERQMLKEAEIAAAAAAENFDKGMGDAEEGAEPAEDKGACDYKTHFEAVAEETRRQAALLQSMLDNKVIDEEMRQSRKQIEKMLDMLVEKISIIERRQCQDYCWIETARVYKA